MTSIPTIRSRIHGCLLGLATAEAVALARSTDTEDSPLRLGPAGQLALYTADALVEVLEWANQGVYADQAATLWLAGLRWAAGQGVPLPSSAPPAQPRWIDAEPSVRRVLPVRPAWVASLASGEMGTTSHPLGLTYDDAAAAARSAPIGLVPGTPASAVRTMALDSAALTHGHPAALQSALAVAHIVHSVLAGAALSEAIDAARRLVQALGSPEPGTVAALGRRGLTAGSAPDAQAPAAQAPAAQAPAAQTPAAQAPAAQALAAAVRGALSAETRGSGAAAPSSFESAARGADDEGPDAAAILGAFLGTAWGADGIPARWRERLEGTEVVARAASMLADAAGAD